MFEPFGLLWEHSTRCIRACKRVHTNCTHTQLLSLYEVECLHGLWLLCLEQPSDWMCTNTAKKLIKLLKVKTGIGANAVSTTRLRTHTHPIRYVSWRSGVFWLAPLLRIKGRILIFLRAFLFGAVPVPLVAAVTRMSSLALEIKIALFSRQWFSLCNHLWYEMSSTHSHLPRRALESPLLHWAVQFRWLLFMFCHVAHWKSIPNRNPNLVGGL